jgi:hypothetical protein
VADGVAGRLAGGIAIDDVRLEIRPSLPRSTLTVRHAQVTVPASAVDLIVRSAPLPNGLQVSASLKAERLEVAVRASLLRVRIAFRPAVDRGYLVLTPSGGVPGLLLGLAANMVSGRPGITMSSDGQIRVDPRAVVPEGVTLPTGFTTVDVSQDRIVLTVG